MNEKRRKPSDYSRNLGAKIKGLRELSGFTQTEFAEKLGYSSTGTISLVEKGERGMRREKLVIAAKLLGVDVKILLDDNKLSPEDIKIVYKFYKYISMPKSKRPGFFKKFTEQLKKL